MIDVRLEDLLERQCGAFAVWQLTGAGWTRKRISCAVARLGLAGVRTPHDGVYVVGRGPLGDAQRWWAATLTAPWSVLHAASAAAAHGLGEHERGRVTIVRPGRDAPYSCGPLRVSYSGTLRGQVVRAPAGFWVTTPERTVIDTWARLPDRPRRKLLREGLRTRQVSVSSMTSALQRHRGRRGVASLRVVLAGYALLQLERCRSDAEARAMEILLDAGLVLPGVNEEVAGEEADLSWPELRAIIEIDGPQWHRLRDDDARKTAVWMAAGHTVRRMGSDDVFADPDRLIALAVGLGVPEHGF